MGLPSWKVIGGHGRTLEGRCGPHPAWIELPHIPLPLTSDRKGKELLMALFLRRVQRYFLTQRNSQPSPPIPRTENWCQRARHVSHNFGRILFPEMLLPEENVAISRCLWCKDEGCNFSRNSENMKACIKTASI